MGPGWPLRVIRPPTCRVGHYMWWIHDGFFMLRMPNAYPTTHVRPACLYYRLSPAQTRSWASPGGWGRHHLPSSTEAVPGYSRTPTCVFSVLQWLLILLRQKSLIPSVVVRIPPTPSSEIAKRRRTSARDSGFIPPIVIKIRDHGTRESHQRASHLHANTLHTMVYRSGYPFIFENVTESPKNCYKKTAHHHLDSQTGVSLTFVMIMARDGRTMLLLLLLSHLVSSFSSVVEDILKQSLCLSVINEVLRHRLSHRSDAQHVVQPCPGPRDIHGRACGVETPLETPRHLCRWSGGAGP